ncbi:MAG: hypothetical protein K0R18_30 [Bacillales bacterium]|jgi:hypothetical protein|nr:hypothetical protein [Bacillales bacterium]
MFEKINVDSQEKFDKRYGDKMSLSDFLESCEDGSFIDYDGFASEIILNGNVIHKAHFYPSDALENKNKLLALQNELGELEIVWYNR